jgi:DNA-binding MarR family transcriptional regulator
VLTREVVAAHDVALVADLFEAVGLLRRQVRSGTGRPLPFAALSGSQLEVIRLVRRRPGISVAETAADLGLAPNTISTLVRHLSDSGLLTRDSDPMDRRVARLTLTPDARAHVEAWRERRSALAVEALQHLDRDDREVLATALPVIIRLAQELRPGQASNEDAS